MTWTLAGTITDSTYQIRWRNFFDNYLHLRGGWVVGAHPGGNGNYRILRYDYTDDLDSTTKAYYYWYSGSNVLYEDGTYTATPGDLATNTNNSVTMRSAIVNDWKVWTSNLSSESIIMTDGKNLIFNWFEPSNIYQPIAASWDPGAYNPAALIYPRMLNGSQQSGNWGVAASSTTEVALIPNVAQGSDNSYYQADFDRYFQTYGLQPSNGGTPFVLYNQADILIIVPGNGIGTSGSSTMVGTTGATVFDGTKYWYRTESDLSHSSYLLDYNTSEPDFT